MISADWLGIKNDICSYTLVLEQLLTTGGGWQDQYGGVFSGIKLLQSEAGFEQNPLVRWLPDQLFVHPDYRDCHLLYYTGITRTAKSILAEIVSSMFLNSGPHLSLLAEMKAHAMDMSEAILRSNFDSFGRLVGKTWIQNQALDCGTNPPAVAAIIEENQRLYPRIQTPRRRRRRLFIYGSQRPSSSRTDPTDIDRTSSQPTRSFCRNDAF